MVAGIDKTGLRRAVHGSEIRAKCSCGGKALRLTVRYKLSGDGKTLTLLRRCDGRGGEQDQTLVLWREQ